MRRATRTTGPVALVLVLSLFAAACTTRDAPAVGTAPATDGTGTTATSRAPTLEWDDCDDGLECAALTVPLDHDDPTRGTVDLVVIRRPATGEDPIGSLVVNPGGPGASGVEFVRAGGVAELAERFDVVSWDPRGAGGSRPLDCATDLTYLALDPSPDDPAERAALDDAAQEVAAECAAADPELLPTLTTETAARDLELLRHALGDEPLTYLGFSYGTHIGLVYAARYPGNVRAMVLDGVVDPAESTTEFLTGQAVEMERVLGADRAALDELAARLEADPLPSRDGGEVGPAELGLAAFASVYDVDGAGLLAAAVRQAQQGDGTALGRLAASYLLDASFAAYLGVVCVDDERPTDLESWWAFVDRISAAAPLVGASVGNEVLPCAWWPVDPGPVVPVPSEPTEWPAELPPLLLVASTQDAATPLDDAERVAAALPRSALVVRDGPGHTSFGVSACVDRVVRAYLVDLTVPDEGLVCDP